MIRYLLKFLENFWKSLHIYKNYLCLNICYALFIDQLVHSRITLNSHADRAKICTYSICDVICQIIKEENKQNFMFLKHEDSFGKPEILSK